MAPSAGRAQQASGVVKVRLSGDRVAVDMVADMLAGACEVLDRSGPRPNCRDAGERIYLTLRAGGHGTGPRAPGGP